VTCGEARADSLDWAAPGHATAACRSPQVSTLLDAAFAPKVPRVLEIRGEFVGFELKVVLASAAMNHW
jgi:hypothetical protein